MTDHPSTYRGQDCNRIGIQWDDRASLHREGDGDGVLSEAKALRNGTFFELVQYVMLMPERDRPRYYIEKAGDRQFHYPEIAILAGRNDFPA